MAKLNRERRVQEKRELKREKKEAAKLARLHEAEGGVPMEGSAEDAEATQDAEAADEDSAATPA